MKELLETPDFVENFLTEKSEDFGACKERIIFDELFERLKIVRTRVQRRSSISLSDADLKKICRELPSISDTLPK